MLFDQTIEQFRLTRRKQLKLVRLITFIFMLNVMMPTIAIALSDNTQNTLSQKVLLCTSAGLVAIDINNSQISDGIDTSISISTMSSSHCALCSLEDSLQSIEATTTSITWLTGDRSKRVLVPLHRFTQPNYLNFLQARAPPFFS